MYRHEQALTSPFDTAEASKFVLVPAAAWRAWRFLYIGSRTAVTAALAASSTSFRLLRSYTADVVVTVAVVVYEVTVSVVVPTITVVE